jgi:subtilisin family serine protease
MNVGANPVWSGLSGFRGSLFDSDDAGGDGHGTHVASIAAARLDGNNTRPNNMQGVAYNSSLIIAGWDPNSNDQAVWFMCFVRQLQFGTICNPSQKIQRGFCTQAIDYAFACNIFCCSDQHLCFHLTPRHV